MNESGVPGAAHDDARTVWSAILVALVGMDVFMVQPGFIQGLVQHLGFSEESAGYVASAEMFGIALATVVLTPLTRRLQWRRSASVAMLVSVLANLLSLRVETLAGYVAVRGVAGLASGLLITYGYAVIGQCARPDRYFGYLITALCCYSAIVLLALPTLLAFSGMRGLIGLFCLLPVLGVLVVHRLPGRLGDSAAQGRVVASIEAKSSRLTGSMGLGAVLAFFLTQGMIWSYLFLIGIADHIPEEQVSVGLTVSQIGGILGAMTAALLAPRIGAFTSLWMGVGLGVGALWLLVSGHGRVSYDTAVTVYNFSANLLTPLVIAIIASVAPAGRLVSAAVALQMLGLAIGPAAAANLWREGDGLLQLVSSCEVLLIGSALLLMPVLMHQRRQAVTPPMAV